MTPPEKLRQIADEMDCATDTHTRDRGQVKRWRRMLGEICNAMDAALEAHAKRPRRRA